MLHSYAAAPYKVLDPSSGAPVARFLKSLSSAPRNIHSSTRRLLAYFSLQPMIYDKRFRYFSLRWQNNPFSILQCWNSLRMRPKPTKPWAPFAVETAIKQWQFYANYMILQAHSWVTGHNIASYLDTVGVAVYVSPK